MKTKTYKTEKTGYTKGILTAVLKGLVLIIMLLFYFGMSVMAQCAYPVNLMVANEKLSQGDYKTYKAIGTITASNVQVMPGANVIFQAPNIIIQSPSTLQSHLTLKAQDPCTGANYPDNLSASNKHNCLTPGNTGNTCNGSILSVSSSQPGTPIWKWYSNLLGDNNSPDLSKLLGIENTIYVFSDIDTDYFVRDESGALPGAFAQIKIIACLPTCHQ